MIENSCFRAHTLIEGRAAGLTEAERLVLERHLAGCARCRQDSALVRQLAELSARAAASAHVVGSSERLFARAYARAEHEKAARAPLANWQLRARYALALAAVLACVLLAVRIGRRGSGAEPSSSGLVTAGDVSANGRALARGERVPERVALVTAQGSELALAHATVRTPGPATLAWSGADSRVDLASGAVDVSVDPRPKRPFAVKTARFRVDVLGTEFHVDSASVSVSRGRVRVSSPDGVELAVLDAGQRWTVSELVGAPPASDSAEAATDEPAPPAASAQVVRAVSAADSLTLARHALASGDVSAARHALGLALAAHPRADEQAEAHMLLGDAARIAGDAELSAREYLGVFEHFRGLPLAETALFSAARVQAQAGHGARADQLFSRYLVAYPRGQFHSQALERVAAHSSDKP